MLDSINVDLFFEVEKLFKTYCEIVIAYWLLVQVLLVKRTNEQTHKFDLNVNLKRSRSKFLILESKENQPRNLNFIKTLFKHQ